MLLLFKEHLISLIQTASSFNESFVKITQVFLRLPYFPPIDHEK